MKKLILGIMWIGAVGIVLDLAILLTSLAQIALGEGTGYWSPFWRAQAGWIIKLL